MAKLYLVRTNDGNLLLQGINDPSPNADFSLYDLNGEGGDPFSFGNLNWEIVEEVDGIEYEPDDIDSF